MNSEHNVVLIATGGDIGALLPKRCLPLTWFGQEFYWHWWAIFAKEVLKPGRNFEGTRDQVQAGELERPGGLTCKERVGEVNKFLD